jgi:hypothetical protein
MGNNPTNLVDKDGGCVGDNCPDDIVQGDCQCSYRNDNGDRITELSNDTNFSDLNFNSGGQNWTNPGSSITRYSLYENRPDVDGIVTFWEAREFSKNGGGDLYIDESKIDYKSVKEFGVWDFKNGDIQTINFFNVYNNRGSQYRPATADSALSFVYGQLKLKLLDVHTGSVKLMTGHHASAPNAFDVFDFSNPLFHILAGSGAPINMYSYGTGNINTTLNMGSLFDNTLNSGRRR